MAQDRVVLLRDGRRLGYRQYGSTSGFPVFYFHGWPGSRFEAQLLESDAGASGIRVLAVERPGYGLSDFQPGRRLLDWPQDVTELADGLRLKTFSVVGVSGGAPYAAVCAWALRDRLQRVSLVSGLAPLDDPEHVEGMHWGNRFLLSVARHVPQLGRALLAPLGWTLERGFPPILAGPFVAGFAEVDRRTLCCPEVARTLYQSTREAFRSGARGPAWEARIYPRPWGFPLREIQTPVDVWHGGQDRNVPSRMGRHLHREIPGSKLHWFPEEGHLSLPFRHCRRILLSLTPGAE